jgi:hypothetical protein
MTWLILGIVFVAGCVGGALTGLLGRETDRREGCKDEAATRWGTLLFTKTRCRTVFPGFLGDVLLGGIAAVIFWGLYGPAAGTVLLPFGFASGDAGATLRVGELAASLVIGISGSRYLRTEAERLCGSPD